MLTLGRYEELVGDLEPLVAEAPTREKLVAQLMTALFNAGRQAEALDVFSRTRDLLREELGLDPSKELRTVMEQILRQDPGITSAREPGRQRAAGNLPGRATSFVGRETDVARTLEQLVTSRLVTLAGPGGAGKTSLAVEAARAAARDYPDGAWLISLASVGEAAGIVHAVADALEVSIAGGTATHRPTEVLIGHLAGRRLLLLLDNCEHVIDSVAALAEEVLARCPGVTILTTSREVLAVPGEVQLPILPLATPPPDTVAADG